MEVENEAGVLQFHEALKNCVQQSVEILGFTGRVCSQIALICCGILVRHHAIYMTRLEQLPTTSGLLLENLGYIPKNLPSIRLITGFLGQ